MVTERSGVRGAAAQEREASSRGEPGHTPLPEGWETPAAPWRSAAPASAPAGSYVSGAPTDSYASGSSYTPPDSYAPGTPYPPGGPYEP
ncbi:hypothetical protein ACSNOD_30605, partial [Streptomyces sp. URMC 123]